MWAKGVVAVLHVCLLPTACRSPHGRTVAEQRESAQKAAARFPDVTARRGAQRVVNTQHLNIIGPKTRVRAAEEQLPFCFTHRAPQVGMRGSARAFVVAIGVFSLAWLLLRLARHPQRSHVVMMPSQSWGSTFHELYHAQPPASYDGKGGGDMESSARMKQIPRRRPRRGGRRRKPWLPLPLEEEQASRVVEADSVESELHTDGQLPSASSKLAHSLRCKGLIFSEAAARHGTPGETTSAGGASSGGSPVASTRPTAMAMACATSRRERVSWIPGRRAKASTCASATRPTTACGTPRTAPVSATKRRATAGAWTSDGRHVQVKHMPLEAFAALKLKPDPAWTLWADGRAGQRRVRVTHGTAEREARHLAADLEQRAAVLRGNRTRHADGAPLHWRRRS